MLLETNSRPLSKLKDGWFPQHKNCDKYLYQISIQNNYIDTIEVDFVSCAQDLKDDKTKHQEYYGITLCISTVSNHSGCENNPADVISCMK